MYIGLSYGKAQNYLLRHHGIEDRFLNSAALCRYNPDVRSYPYSQTYFWIPADEFRLRLQCQQGKT